MKKTILWWSLALVIISSIVIADKYYSAADKVYVIPEGFEGCVGIIHDVEGAPKLPMKNNTITYKIPDNGVLLTSSHYKIGWAYEDDTGWYDAKFYYGSDNKKKELSKEDKIIGTGWVWSSGIQLENGDFFNRGNYYKFYVGDNPQTGMSTCIDRILQKASNSPLLQK
ncbi:DUF6843 domain-containing protein [Pontibacillus marinus]|uniref:DUF6843 domain-containing protein n=1 Tax=Pontibacillus marinus BH030004 = DSM 16465 TaxID=1385511 RepID=A0A0A5GAF4_9BACI|nr:hypothetical protein [Pontibacillus marinus]KGX90156.1 hypothetical protein N783_01305 [Pontibacillus marinus BH030004 = DSM 16465]